MTGKAEVARRQQQLDATFMRAAGLAAQSELLSDFAKYLCVLVSGFLEQAVIELILEYVRNKSDGRIQSHVERRLRKLTNLKSQLLLDVVGGFDPDWRRSLEPILVDEYKAALDSVVDLRNTIAHGKSVGVTMKSVTDYYVRVKLVVGEVARICK
ncbi:MAG: HEPN domain-containing protein [Elusimicrobiota bacterium]|jgi:hypothetical protein